MLPITFSLIIPTLNAEDYLPSLFNTIRQQSLQPCEIIVIDSTSTDNTSKIAKSYDFRVESIERNAFDHGGTRTLVAMMAKGDILLFLTQDALPADPYTLERIIRGFTMPEIGAVYGRQLPYPDANEFGTHLRLFNYSEKSDIIMGI